MPIEVTLPTLHADQVKAYQSVIRRNRFAAIRCGRRWGKTLLGETIAGDAAIKGYPVAWLAPDYKRMVEVYNDVSKALKPVLTRSSKTEGVIRTRTGGGIDFWTLEDETAGRSRMYKRVIVDEGAFTDPKTMMGIWEKSIKPTLLDYNGTALVLSNTNGEDSENFFWRICNQPEHGFVEYHAPTRNNPTIPRRLRNETVEAWQARRAVEFEKLRTDNPPLVYKQEYEADFVDWRGIAFFALDKMLEAGQPVEPPNKCDSVFAVIDSATKTGKEHDGTGCTYYLRSKYVGYPLIVLDWDLQQIEGALLETWLPTVFANLEALAKRHGAREGSVGVWIEDKNSGSVLLQKAQAKGWPAHMIDSKLTSLGKDERAINVSGNHYRGEVKISRAAHDKVTTYKGTTRNHFEAQVTGYRVGDKTPNREDDLLDTYCYGVQLALGNAEGF